ncbi:cytochrome c [Citrifermentans bemidjiense Bem]|uniref:Cytochrome c n=1 Tax=Citrifermentans bemidjiense (strain ATCC BAA-1014 / DSM 16622 / JCM 12645 / Bem) TaxID=404380 RepID=B5EIH1_CITBB|nr:cytochrome c [Citrifermentans bemidjiense Bem]
MAKGTYMHLWASFAILALSILSNPLESHAQQSQYPISCDECHRMPPLDSPYRNPDTGGFTGNHETHNPPSIASKQSCEKCHAGSGSFLTSHRDGFINMTSNINSSAHPLRSVYNKPRFFNQTTLPTLQTCSNVNCHFETTTPAWGRAAYSSPSDCDKCHQAAPSDGNHPVGAQKHAQYYGTTTSSCAKCHPDHTGEPAPFGHATSAGNRTLSVRFAALPNNGFGRYTGNVAYPYYLPSKNAARSGTCRNTYCHSPGTKPAGSSADPNKSAAWGGTLDCTGCHKGSVSGDYMNTGSHYAHVYGDGSAKSQISCVKCHAATAAADMAISDRSRHVNGQVEVAFDSSSNPTGGSYNGTLATPLSPSVKTPGSNYAVCQNLYCHGGNPVTWGGTVNCQDCHGGGSDADNFGGTFWSDGTTGKIKTAGEWDGTGHGRASGTYPSGTAAANFGVEAKQCEYCHDAGVGHAQASNAFRLRNYSTAAWGRNAVCQNCHGAGSAGVTVGSHLKNSSRKVGSDHYGAKHSNSKNGGQFCWDCHDGHGDTNAYMIHNSVASTSDRTTGAPATTAATSFTAFATGTDYARGAAPYNGICQVCHDSTVNHYTATSGDSHNPGTRCTSCHTHTGPNSSNAFPGSESAGGAPCLGCHATGFANMRTNASYHHYMQNDTATYSNSATPSATDTNRRCLMCHVDHNIFRPDMNAGGARAKNLRTGAIDAVSASVGFTNSDFDNALASGGVCVSCHTNQQTKNSTNRKGNGTTVTPRVTKSEYAGSAHNYAVAGGAFSDASRVNANCIKCHNAQNGETSLKGNFGNHDGTASSILGALGGTLTDPYEAGLCYRCHSNAADAVGGTKKTANARDWYGAVTTMSSRATAIFQSFQKANKHQVDLPAYSGKHKPNAVDESRAYISNAANKHVDCSDCHNPHTATAANPTKGAMGANPTNSTGNWTAPTAWADVSVAGGDDEYKICFRCHSGYNTGLSSWSSAWTDLGKEFSTGNKSYHWIEGDRGAAKADTTYGNFNKTYIYKMMPRYNGFTDAQLRTVRMRCSDCHGSDNAENNPNGPHGSSYARMLKVPAGSPYTTWNSTSQVGGANVWCFNCHLPAFTNSGFSGSGSSLHTSKHSGSKGTCMDCHIKVPHGWQIPHLLKPYNMPANYPAENAAYNGTGTTSRSGIDLPLNSTNWGLSGKWTENSCGSHQNCSGN